MIDDHNLHPELRKNICDLNHERQLQRTHTIINLGAAFWLAMIVGIMTWLIEGGGEINFNLFFFFIIGTSTIVSIVLSFYIASKRKRLYLLGLIRRLNIDWAKLRPKVRKV